MYITQNIANRIKALLKEQNISTKTMLTDLTLGINAISELSKGKQMSCINLARIADYLNCSVDYLLGRTESPDEIFSLKDYSDKSQEVLSEFVFNPVKHKSFSSISDTALKVAEQYDTLDVRSKRLIDFIVNDGDLPAEFENVSEHAVTSPVEYIRHYFVPAAAGYASPIEGEDYELVLKTKETPRNADFCISIQGDSMEPYIKDGQRVFVQRDTSLEQFDVGVFYLDGDVFCKQICEDSFGNIFLLSANPKREDANKVILRDSSSTFVCFGKVLLNKKLPQPVYNA